VTQKTLVNKRITTNRKAITMKILNKLQLLTLLLATVTTFTACANSNAESKKVDAQKGSPAKSAVAQKTPNASSSLQLELDKAKSAGKAVFVVVTGAGTTGIDKATTIAKGATGIYKKAVVIQMDRDLPINAEFVSKWGLSGAPLPLILSISPKGNATGGYTLAEATAAKIAALVPSPKMDDVYVALYNKKPVFLVVSKKSNIDKAAILNNCKSAVTQLKAKATIVEIDLEDPKEAAFIKQLNLQSATNSTTVMVLNASGRTTGMFNGKVETSELVTAATKVISGGCGSSCSPGGC